MESNQKVEQIPTSTKVSSPIKILASQLILFQFFFTDHICYSFT